MATRLSASHDPGRDRDAGPGLELPDARVGLTPRHEAAERRPDAGEEIGHADQVADDVGAVQPDPRDEPVHDQRVLRDHHEEERREAGRRAAARRGRTGTTR